MVFKSMVEKSAYMTALRNAIFRVDLEEETYEDSFLSGKFSAISAIKGLLEEAEKTKVSK